MQRGRFFGERRGCLIALSVYFQTKLISYKSLWNYQYVRSLPKKLPLYSVITEE